MPKAARENPATIQNLKNQSTISAREEDIYTAIYNAVMEHRLPPGTKLTETAFSEHFGVSRTVIRKALFRLAQKNVVELRPNRGAVVASPDIEETHAVFEARRIIEREIIRTVVEIIRPQQLKALKTLATKEQKASDAGDRHTLVRLSGDIHVMLAEIAGNPVLTEFLQELVSRTSLIIALYEAPGVSGCGSHDHWGLIELIENGDIDSAADAMLEHLTEIEGRLNLTRREGNIDLTSVFDN